MRCSLFVVRCMLCAFCLLVVRCCLLFRLFVVVCGSLFVVACRLLFVVCSLLFGG